MEAPIREESKAVTAQKRLRLGHCFNRGAVYVVEGAGLNVVVMPPIEQKAAAKAARAVPAVQALAVQGVDSRGVLHVVWQKSAQVALSGSSQPVALGSPMLAHPSALGLVTPAGRYGDTPCVQHNRRTPEPWASSTSGTNLFAFVAIATCAAARQITP